ncbi:hypothetical protein N9558_00475 [Porticoccaceae bacterium]|nr:hypothetical protein [Porticoccaceae bacterium]
MALFVSVLGLSGLAAFALLGFTMELAKMITKSMRTPLYFVRRQYAWKFAL